MSDQRRWNDSGIISAVAKFMPLILVVASGITMFSVMRYQISALEDKAKEMQEKVGWLEKEVYRLATERPSRVR